jgi:hypothetical protein
MAELDYDRLVRVLTRSKELGEAAGGNASVTLAYTDLLRAPATAYLAAHDRLTRAESAAKKESSEAATAIASFDLPYSLARMVIRGYLPSEVLPDTLKALATDTDRKNAIIKIRNVLEEHRAEPWALTLLTGDFGTRADDVIREVTEWIAANGDLDEGVKARAAAYGPAYEQYLAFKGIVRQAHGASSTQYERIHIRSRRNGTTDPNIPPVSGPTS